MPEISDLQRQYWFGTRSIQFRDYAPAMDGSTDDSAKLTQAIADAVSYRLPLVIGTSDDAPLGSNPVVGLGSGVPVNGDVDIIGGHRGMTLRALSGFSPVTMGVAPDEVTYGACLAIDGEARVSNLIIDGNEHADYGTALHSASRSSFWQVRWRKAIRDGLHFPADNGSRNNNLVRIRDCVSGQNGRVFAHGQPATDFEATAATSGFVVTHTATASVVGGTTSTVTFSESIADTGVRTGSPIVVGDSPRTHGVVRSVDSTTQLSCFLEDTGFSGSGLDWGIGVGDGVFIGADGDNNLTRIDCCEVGGNRGWQLSLSGFYGTCITNPLITSAPWGAVLIGQSNATYRHGTSVLSAYIGDGSKGYSGHLDRANWTLCGAFSVFIHQNISEHAEASGLIVRRLTGTCSGELRYRSTVFDLGAL